MSKTSSRTLNGIRWLAVPVGVCLAACDSTTTPAEPLDDPDAPAVTAITAGSDHSCVLTTDGRAWCWGSNETGQLGSGDLEDRGSPYPVSTDLRFVSIAGGFGHTCAIAESGAAYCWGENSFGQVGDGTTDARLEPTRVTALPVLTGISAGGLHSCGWTAAGEGFCWGDNRSGQLGDGTSTSSLEPTPVSGALSFLDLAAGLETTCGRSAGEEVYCWGRDEFGLVGTPTANPYLEPTATGIAGVALSLNQKHACVLTVTGGGGRTACWGDNSEAQLGDGTVEPRSSPVSPNGTPDFVLLSQGARNTHTCGVTVDRQVRCWGANTWAQSGRPSWQWVVPPGSVALGRSIFALIAAGREHSCAADVSGGVHCWGTNRRGQLGRGSSAGATTTSTPREIVWEYVES